MWGIPPDINVIFNVGYLEHLFLKDSFLLKLKCRHDIVVEREIFGLLLKVVSDQECRPNIN